MAYRNEDIAACQNKECRNKWQCLRWQLALNNDPYQTYIDGKSCNGKFYIDNQNYK